MIIKNVFDPLNQLKKYFTFEVQVLDDKNVRRRFRASNYQSTTRVKPFICTMPMRLDEGISKFIQGGTKSNLIYQILQEEHMVQITLKLYVLPSMRIAVSEEYTFLTDCTVKRNSHHNLNCFCQSKNNNEYSVAKPTLFSKIFCYCFYL